MAGGFVYHRPIIVRDDSEENELKIPSRQYELETDKTAEQKGLLRWQYGQLRW